MKDHVSTVYCKSMLSIMLRSCYDLKSLLLSSIHSVTDALCTSPWFYCLQMTVIIILNYCNQPYLLETWCSTKSGDFHTLKLCLQELSGALHVCASQLKIIFVGGSIQSRHIINNHRETGSTTMIRENIEYYLLHVSEQSIFSERGKIR